MRDMKDSGVEWLGEVPSDWEIRPLWSIYRRVKRTNYPDELLLSVYRDYGVIPKTSRDDNHNVESLDLSSYQLVEPSDLAVNKMKAWQGSLSISGIRGIVSPAYFVFKLHTQGLHTGYLHHLLRSMPYVLSYLLASKGVRIGQWDLQPESFRKTPVLLPPLGEQKMIARHIDQETSQIDLLISKKEQLIEKLLERRQALITHVVTKGLDPNAPMKDSGVEWIGVAPKNWESLRVSHLATRKRVKAFDLGVVTAFRDGQVTLRSNRRIDGFTEATEFHGYQLIKPGQLAVHRMDAFAGAIGVSDSEGMCSPVLTVLDCNQKIDAHYLALFLRVAAKSGWIEALAKSIRERTSEFGWNELSSQQSLVPPIDEQRAIVAYLTNETSQIDTLMQKTKKAIELLKERRQALITQVVTGKMDVRGFTGGNS